MTQKQFVIGLGKAIAFVVLVTLGMDAVSKPSGGWVIMGLGILILTAVLYEPMAVRWITRGMEKITAMFVILLLLTVSGCGTRIEPGHVGVLVHLYGGDKGVDFEPVPVGMVWYNPGTSVVYQYPTFVQTAIWTKSPDEGRNGVNEEMTFNTKEGMLVSADISLSYHLEASKVPAFFGKFRSDQLSTFTHGFLRNIARDAFNDIAPTYSVEQIYGEKKEEMRRAVQARIQEQVVDYGVTLEQFGYVGGLRLPQPVVDSLNAKIQATQNAMRVQNEVAQTQAEAQKAVAVAKGAAEARLALANAEATANKTIAASITPELVQYMTVQRWNGARPQVEGATGGVLLQLPTSGK